MRISNSFSEGEIQVMDFIVQTLLRGGSPNMATRHKEFASLCRKVMAMKGKVLEKQQKQMSDGAEDDASGDNGPSPSSVGTIEAPAIESAMDSSIDTPKSTTQGLATAV